jgi:hypothetical protein
MGSCARGHRSQSSPPSTTPASSGTKGAFNRRLRSWDAVDPAPPLQCVTVDPGTGGCRGFCSASLGQPFRERAMAMAAAGLFRIAQGQTVRELAGSGGRRGGREAAVEP